MSTLKVDNIRHNNATSDAITMASDGTCTAKVTNPLTNRRLNYNGAMLVNQRENSTNTNGFSSYHGPDRYYSQGNGANNGYWDIGQSTDVPDGYGFKYSLSYDCTATTSDANRYLMTVYRMEGVDCQLLNYGTANAKTVTLSFWIKCSKAGNFQVNFENEENPDAGYQTQQTINSAGQWEKKVVTIPGDTTKALTFGTQKAFCFDIVYSAFGTYAADTPTAAWSTLSNGQRGTHCNMDLFDSTSNYVRITGVQLELGSHATEFEHLPYQVELQRCQRYYERIPIDISNLFLFGVNQFGSPGGIQFPFKVSKRAVPATSIDGSSSGNFSYYKVAGSGSNGNANFTVNSYTTEAMEVRSAGAAANGVFWTNKTSSGYIDASAEL